MVSCRLLVYTPMGWSPAVSISSTADGYYHSPTSPRFAVIPIVRRSAQWCNPTSTLIISPVTIHDLPYYHVRPVVAHGINTPPDGPLPRHQPNASLNSPGAGWPRHRTGHDVAEAIVQMLLRLYIRLGNQDHVKSPALHLPYGLRQPESPAIPYF